MKSLFLFLFIVVFAININAQTPEKLNYQAVVRDAMGAVVADQQVGVQVNIIQGALPGTVVYTETFSASTNGFGLINLEVGGGTAQTGVFSDIDWSTGTYFLNVQVDAAGGTTYADMGTVQLLSVPYALYAKTAGNSFSGNYNDLTRNKPVLNGDVTGATDANTVVKIQGKEVSENIPANGQVLKWNNTAQRWEPADDQLGAAGTTDGVVTSANFTGTATKTLTLIRSNGLGDITAVFTDEVNDADADASNEIQTLSINANELSISSGNTVTIPQTIYTAGSGIGISGTTITNSAPDQTVFLAGDGATTISGTYPNYTISSTDENTVYTGGTGIVVVGDEISNTAPDQTVSFTTGTGISVSGTYPDFHLENTNPDQTINISGSGSTTVTGTYPNYVISTTDNNTTYTGGSGITITGTTISNSQPDQTVTITGGGSTTIGGTYPNFTVTSTDNNTTYTAGNGLTLSGTVFSANNDDAIWNANKIHGKDVVSTNPTNGQVLKYDGTNWIPSTDLNNNYSAGSGLSLTGTTFSHNTHTGDVTGNTALTVTGIQGRQVTSNAPANGQILITIQKITDAL